MPDIIQVVIQINRFTQQFFFAPGSALFVTDGELQLRGVVHLAVVVDVRYPEGEHIVRTFRQGQFRTLGGSNHPCFLCTAVVGVEERKVRVCLSRDLFRITFPEFISVRHDRETTVQTAGSVFIGVVEIAGVGHIFSPEVILADGRARDGIASVDSTVIRSVGRREVAVVNQVTGYRRGIFKLVIRIDNRGIEVARTYGRLVLRDRRIVPGIAA